MDNNEGFSYTYSAARQQEVERIRSKYLPKAENEIPVLPLVASAIIPPSFTFPVGYPLRSLCIISEEISLQNAAE